MVKVETLQSARFRKQYKKLHPNQRESVKKAVRKITENPQIGSKKSGDLWQVYVYKFKIDKKEYLLAYQWDIKTRLLLALGIHENFYRDLKKQIK